MSGLLFHASRNCQFRFSIERMLITLKENYISFFSSFQKAKYSNSLSFLRTYRTFFITFLTRYTTRKTIALPFAYFIYRLNVQINKFLGLFVARIYQNYKLYNSNIIEYKFRNNEKEKFD
ncbi:hypothetical protein ATE84_3916 [Aquimarina sp. MAR_2010_214]|nr:hypothetical protein ATE84_3916 [Aquimarina sp. MAR_2010_214]